MFKQMLLVFAAISSCATPQSSSKYDTKSTSVKGILEPKKDVSCTDIPLNGDKDIGAKSAKFLRVPPYGYYFGIQQRNGRMGHFFAEFDGSQSLDRSNFKERSFGNEAMFVGFLPRPKKIYVVIARPDGKSESSVVEIRDLVSNKIIFTSHSLGVEITDGQTFSAKDGVWLVFNKETERAFALFLRDQGGDRWRVEYSLRDPEMIDAHLSLSKENGLIMALAEKGKKGEVTVKVSEVDPVAKSKKQFVGVLGKLDGALESWAVTSLGEGIGIAAVIGDSLVGKAQLYIATMERNQERLLETWRKSFSLNDRHVGSPFFLSTSSILGNPVLEASVGLVSWVTDEAFLETFRLDAKKSGAQTVFGGLKPNSVVTESAVESRQKKGILSIRQKRENSFRFEICTVDL